MEDQERDSQESETSSTHSWIILEGDDINDFPPEEAATAILNDAANTLKDLEVRNGISDTDSDGISVISESEFIQTEKSDDEIADSVEKLEESSKSTELIDNTSISNENETVDTTFEETEIQNVSTDKMLVPKLPTEAPQSYDYKILFTWPSLLCTSVVIFAVIIFPYFSSKINDANTIDQSNVDQYDINLLTNKNIVDFDPLQYCKQIQKINLISDRQLTKCVKKVLNTIKKAKKRNVATEFNLLNEHNDIGKISTRQEIENEEKTKKEYLQRKKNKFRNKHEESTNDGDYKLRNDKISKQSKKESKRIDRFDSEDDEDDQCSNKKKPHGKNRFCNKKKTYESPEHATNKKLDNLQQKLIEKMETLAKKEKYLQEWEAKLTETKNALENEIASAIKRGILKQKTDTPVREKFKKETNPKHKYNDNKKRKSQGKLPPDDQKYLFLKNEPNSSKQFHRNSKKNQTATSNDDNVTVSGDWYLNLLQSRHDVRKRVEKSNWWFDRAEFRKSKRDKAHWYFQYMFNREYLRYRTRNI